MNWSDTIDNYCERLGPDFWAEPVNALSNAAFILVAIVMLRRVHGDKGATVLGAILLIIGIGSFLFHTFAQTWAALADVLPILAFILVYIYLATCRFWAAPWHTGLMVAVCYIPFTAMLSAGLGPLIGGLNGSLGYVPVVLVILLYALMLSKRAAKTARGLAFGAGILAVSLSLRTLDTDICARLPLGTHFMWHILNAIMLGWMIHVLHSHPRLAPARRGG